jgi:membrane-bound ClpP family serine protease
MKGLAIVLIVVGIVGLVVSAVLPVVGIAGVIGSVAMLITGIGFFLRCCSFWKR